MKIKINGYMEWLLSAANVKDITHYDREHDVRTADSVDRCSMYPQSMIPRQLGHE